MPDSEDNIITFSFIKKLCLVGNIVPYHRSSFVFIEQKVGNSAMYNNQI